MPLLWPLVSAWSVCVFCYAVPATSCMSLFFPFLFFSLPFPLPFDIFPYFGAASPTYCAITSTADLAFSDFVLLPRNWMLAAHLAPFEQDPVDLASFLASDYDVGAVVGLRERGAAVREPGR